MAKKNETNPAEVHASEDLITGARLITDQNQTAAPEGWESEQTSFPPYWTPVEGKTFRGIVVDKDVSDPEFVRFTLKATTPVTCSRGPADDMTEVQVKAGEFFTVSSYAALPLDRYAGCEVFVKALSQIPLKGGKSLWQFDLKIAPETRRMLNERAQKQLSNGQA